MLLVQQRITAFVLLIGIGVGAPPAFACGGEGHEIVALVAQSFLNPAVPTAAFRNPTLMAITGYQMTTPKWRRATCRPN